MADWLAGQRITADRLNAALGVWQDYPVTWESSGTFPSVGNGMLTGRFMQVGSTVDFMIRLVAGSTTSFGTGAFDFGLPVAPRSVGGSSNLSAAATCVIEIGPPSAQRYSFGVLLFSTGLVRVANGSTTGLGGGGHAGHDWQSGNLLLISGRYEVD